MMILVIFLESINIKRLLGVTMDTVVMIENNMITVVTDNLDEHTIFVSYSFYVGDV